MLCLSIKPVVDRLEQTLEGIAGVIRLNVREEVGKQIWDRYQLEVVPSFIVLSGSGQEIWRQQGESPDRQRIVETIQLSLSQ